MPRNITAKTRLSPCTEAVISMGPNTAEVILFLCENYSLITEQHFVSLSSLINTERDQVTDSNIPSKQTEAWDRYY